MFGMFRVLGAYREFELLQPGLSARPSFFPSFLSSVPSTLRSLAPEFDSASPFLSSPVVFARMAAGR